MSNILARLAYITTPEPERFIINVQAFGSDKLVRVEIMRAHLANIVADGANMLLRESTLNRVSINQPETTNDPAVT